MNELRRHAGTQFDPDLVALFCDLFANHAPAPDPVVLAMTQGSVAAEAAHETPRRRRRRTAADGSESAAV
jgi:HD-GYP domain-containing protein (c-di-GMP phosphodiesterase class II)